MNNITQTANHLIIGQGDIGSQVSNLLAKQGYQVTGLARGDRSNYPLDDKVQYMQANALELTAKQLSPFTHICIIVAPSEYHEQAYHDCYLVIAEYIASLAEQLPNLKRLVFISSTGVYGQDNGEWIDENTQPMLSKRLPKRAGSQFILQAEQVLQQAFTDKLVIIRPSGIYGQQRLLRIKQAKQSNKTPMSPCAWTNRIMDSDLVVIIAKVLQSEQVKPIYLATDYQPVTSYEIIQWLCQQLQTEPPLIDHDKQPTGKRIHSNIPLDWLEFADWQAGYRMILDNLNSSV